jgi:flagellar biosynthesis protein FlhG
MWQRKSEAAHSPDVWAVAGGKGGVGKSVVAANLAVAVARSGLTCLLIDADLGAGNQHTIFGVETPKKSLDEFLRGDEASLEDVAQPSRYFGLSLAYAQCDDLGSANPKHSQKQKFIRHIKKAPYDVVIVDLGAGTSFNTLDLFLAARVHLVVTTPEPTAVQNAYGFIKCSAARDKAAGDVSQFVPRVLVNQATEDEARGVFRTLAAVTSAFLNAHPSQAGSVRKDPAVATSVMRGAPVVALSPTAPSARDIDSIAQTLLEECFERRQGAPRDTTLARGMNDEFKVGDRIYHVQTEDLGAEKSQIRTQVFERGRVVFSKVLPYGVKLSDGRVLPRQQQVEFQHRVVAKAILEQRLG